MKSSSSTALAIACAAAMIWASACGSSSKTETFTSPTTTKCALDMNVDGAPFAAAGGSGSVRITTTRDCQWAAKTDAAWLTIAAPADGQGDGTVRFSLGANADPAARTADITINDRRLEVSQAGKPCEFTLSASHESVSGAGGDLTIDVQASGAACDWTASSSVSWISLVSGRQGRGNGKVTLHVDAVTGPPRTGNVVIGGQTVQIEQGTGCTYSVDANAFNVDASGGQRQVAVTSPATCAWTAESQVPWITVVSGATGSATGVVVFRVAASDGPGRTGQLSVAGRTVTVTQSIGCSYSTAPSTVNVAGRGANATIRVDAAAGCNWSAASAAAWISISSGANGSGPGQVQLAIAANGGSARAATVTVAGQPVTVAQESGCSYAIAPPSQDVNGDGGTVVATVTTNPGCAWNAASSLDWVAANTATGTGPGQVSFTVQPNFTPPRNGTVTVAGQPLAISQASQCRWSFAPREQDFDAAGGNGTVLVFLIGGACSWTAVPKVSWIQITAGASGVGPGFLQFVVPANTGAARTGVIVIGGEDYVVRQAGR